MTRRPGRLSGGVPRPVSAPPAAQSPEVDSFISGAPRKETLPWMHPRVRDDLNVQLNVRQPERLMLQVEWLAAHHRVTKQGLVETALREYVAKELKRLGLPE